MRIQVLICHVQLSTHRVMDYPNQSYHNVTIHSNYTNTVADPGFPVGGGGRAPVAGGQGALFTENVCKNKRIGSHGGGGACAGHAPLIRQWNTLPYTSNCIQLHFDVTCNRSLQFDRRDSGFCVCRENIVAAGEDIYFQVISNFRWFIETYLI